MIYVSVKQADYILTNVFVLIVVLSEAQKAFFQGFFSRGVRAVCAAAACVATASRGVAGASCAHGPVVSSEPGGGLPRGAKTCDLWRTRRRWPPFFDAQSR